MSTRAYLCYDSPSSRFSGIRLKLNLQDFCSIKTTSCYTLSDMELAMFVLNPTNLFNLFPPTPPQIYLLLPKDALSASWSVKAFLGK